MRNKMCNNIGKDLPNVYFAPPRCNMYTILLCYQYDAMIVMLVIDIMFCTIIICGMQWLFTRILVLMNIFMFTLDRSDLRCS